MSLGPQRLLGLAFASADLLMEIAPKGEIVFAVGASEALSGSPETALVGRPWRDFVSPEDHAMVQAVIDGLGDGQRAGPTIVILAPQADKIERAATLSVFRLPGNRGAISCALSRAAPPRKGEGQNGLYDRAAFEAAASTLFETARMTGQELELALIELNGLEAVRKSAPAQAEGLEQKVAGGLRAQAHGGAATDLGGDRFALIRQRGENPETMAARLVRVVGLDSQFNVGASAVAMSLTGDAPSGQLLRAVRYSLDGFIRSGVDGARSGSLSDAMARSLQRTLADVGALGDAVLNRSFRLAFQPVVNLKAGGALHHHEVLVRFGDDASPFPMIRMAEELDMIEPLDLAVTEEAIKRMAKSADLKLAVNVSGRTICSGDFIDKVLGMVRRQPGLKGRLMFELTESAAIDDLGLAERHLQALRAQGLLICLDDFGAGAASLAYLQQLNLDVVKIDGAYIRDLEHGRRESTFIRHLVTMCGELGVKTLAEMVETPQVEDAVRRAGVDFAQGWLYGAAAERPGQPTRLQEPLAPAPKAVRPAPRRVGAVDGWS